MVTLPNILSFIRLGLIPVLLVLAWRRSDTVFLYCLVASLSTDLLDGFLARRLNQSSELGAKLDSWADLLTYLSLPLCLWWLRPEIIRHEATWLIIVLVGYFAEIGAGYWKFGRLTSYHTWMAKVASVVVGAAILICFAGGPSWTLRLALPIVALSSLENIVITLLLPENIANVPSLFHAQKIREESG